MMIDKPDNIPDEEWCYDCEDYDHNCSCDNSEYGRWAAEREREQELEDEAGGKEGLDHDRGVCRGPGCCRWCDEAVHNMVEDSPRTGPVSFLSENRAT